MGGPSAFEPFLAEWIESNKFGTVDTDHFRSAFRSRFGTIPAAAAIDWDAWLYTTGMPPVDLSAFFDLSLRESADALARRWHFCNVLGAVGGAGAPATDRPDGASAADMAGWPSDQARNQATVPTPRPRLVTP